MNISLRHISLGLLLVGILAWNGVARAADEAPPADPKIRFADGELKLTPPAAWQRKKPESNIVEHEFTVTAVAPDELNGRMTLMGAGGSVDANVERWIGQFSQPDGSSTKDSAKIKKVQIAGEDVHLIDISGTYKDQKGPFLPGVEREKYRMIAAIITTKKLGNYFVKFYGPQRTVAENESAFLKMIDSLEKK